MTVNRLCVLFFLFAYCGLCFGSQYESLGYGFFPGVNGWLRLSTEPSDWLTARINCHMQGAFLMSPWSEEFLYTVDDLRKHLQYESLEAIYSGVQSTYAEGALVYENGKPKISLNHQDMAPLERCGVFFSNGTTGLVRCDQQLPYICFAPETDVSVQIEAKPQDPALSLTMETHCGEPSLGYEYSETTGKCYKFHPQAVHEWYDAKAACIEEGAKLAIINSRDEAQVLSDLYKRFPPNKIHGAPYPDTAAIGVYKGSDDEWKTIEGETLQEAGYDSWTQGAPHEWAKLGFINRDGQLYGYVPAIRDVPYICEKKPSWIAGTEQATTTEEATTTEPATTTEQVTTTEQATTPEQVEFSTTSLCKTPDYEYFEFTGNCYKFHQYFGSNIDEAQNFCGRENAKVAEFDSDEEGSFLMNLFLANPLPPYLPFDKSFVKKSTYRVYDDGMKRYFSNQEFVMHIDKGYAYNTNALFNRFICEQPSALSKATVTPEPIIEKSEEQSSLASRCEDGYVFFKLTGNCYKYYKVITDNIDYDSAQGICNLDMANIAEVDHDYEASFLKYLTIVQEKRSEDSDSYSPMENASIEGSGDDSLDQYYPEFFTEHGRIYAYQLFSIKNQFICEKPSIRSKVELVTTTTEPVTESKPTFEQTDFTSKCGDDDFGYEFAKQTGQCYKFHPRAIHTWDDAREACEAEGAHLAIVNSDIEADTLSKLFANYPPNKISGSYYPDTAAVGCFYNNNAGEWQTLEGETLDQAGYNSWRPDAPSMMAKYGYICRDGLLYGYVSSVTDMPFICEKPSEFYNPELITSETEIITSETDNILRVDFQSTSANPEFEIENETATESVETVSDVIESLDENYGDFVTETAVEISKDNEAESERIEPDNLFDLLRDTDIVKKRTPHCGNNDLGYEYLKRIGKCYKYHTEKLSTWSEMEHVCNDEGAHIALFKHNELNFILDITERIKPVILDAYISNIITSVINYKNNGNSYASSMTSDEASTPYSSEDQRPFSLVFSPEDEPNTGEKLFICEKRSQQNL